MRPSLPMEHGSFNCTLFNFIECVIPQSSSHFDVGETYVALKGENQIEEAKNKLSV